MSSMMERQANRSVMAFLWSTLFVDAVCSGMMIPVLPSLLVQITGETTAGASTYSGWLYFTYAISQFTFAPIIGLLSDRHGRRIVFLTSLFGGAINYAATATSISIQWLFWGRALAGAMGAAYPTAYACAADITPAHQRARAFAILSSASGLGFYFGPAFGGLLGEYDIRLPLIIGSSLSLLNAMYGIIGFRETLDKDSAAACRTRTRLTLLGIIQSLRADATVVMLLVVVGLNEFARAANRATLGFYTISKFNWTPKEIGLLVGAFGVSLAFVQAVVAPYILPKLKEVNSAILGSVAGAIGFFLFSIATAGWMMYTTICIWCIWGLSMPSTRALLSSSVPNGMQGKLQGTISGVNGFVAIFAPVVMSQVFAYFSSTRSRIRFVGAAYVLSSAILLLSAILLVRLKATLIERHEEPDTSMAAHEARVQHI